MALSEIEKLERRYAENPQGLTFAPLAEVHRKNGEVQRALDLLGPGLQLHPDYIPASIVLGRCHMDLGDVHAAEAAFLRVLALDGENVIALKALADISERLLKLDDAERWLRTLLTVDRSSDEAREQLQRVEIARRQAEVASSAEPASVLEAPAVPDALADAVLPLLPDIAPATTPFQPPAAEPAAGSLGFAELEPAGLGDEFVEEPAAVEPLDGLVGRELDTPDQEVASIREEFGDFGGDFAVETSEDIILQSAGGSEFQMPDASQELFAAGARGERAPFEEDAPITPGSFWEPPRADPTLEPKPPQPAESREKSQEPMTAKGPVAEESRPYTPEPLVPEPDAPEPYAPEPYAPEPYAPEPIEYQPPPAPPRRSYSVGDTGGRSVAHLFKGILSARPPLQPFAAPVRQAAPGDSAGAPTRPAADALSLSSVFGEEDSATPPAVPAPNPPAGSVSFDDFFGSPSSSPAARTPRTPDSKNDDLDQFHAWLQNLKR